MVLVESDLVTTRVTREAASLAALNQMAVSSLLNKKAGKHFDKTMKAIFAED